MSHSRLLSRFEALSRSTDVALRDELGQCTFAELAASARGLAARLAREGLGNERLALLAPQDRRWLVGFWATLLAGGTVVPLSPLHPAREQAFFLDESRSAALLLAEPLAAPSPGARVLRFGPDEAGGTPTAEAGPQRHDLREPTPGADAERAIALILYTSGTTGKPKGVLLSHGNVLDGVLAVQEAWQVTAADRVLHTLPLHHVHGICVSLLCAFTSGASTDMLPRYDPACVLESARHASVLMAVPTQHMKLVQYLDGLPDGEARCRYRAHLSALRLITSGSAALPEKLGRRLEALSGQYPLERYGMTEVGIVLGNPLAGPRLPGSVGRPLPRCDVRIVDPAGRDCAPGEPGEIWIAAPSVFQGYDGDAAATAAAFSQGYFKSGDTACWADDGYVKILGRTSVDIIKSGGYKLSALELEEHLREHAWVSDVAVVGVPDEVWGESVLAVVVPTQALPSASAEAGEQLRTWLKSRVAAYKVPRRVLFRAQLPRNALGKVQKPLLLAELARAGAAGSSP